jgi:hypothetical protein
VVFGEGTPIVNATFSISDPAATTSDQAMPGDDGVMMGRDYLQGRTLSWDLVVNRETGADGRVDWRALESAWDARSVRLTPGAVMPVRMRMPGGATVVAYGRPRKIAPADTQFMDVGRISVVADFSTADRFFYDDVEQEISFGIQPTIAPGGGITWPATWPITWAEADTSNIDVVVNAGDAPTWPVVTFDGPVIDPTLILGDDQRTLKVVTMLASNESVTIDTRPWNRSVTRQDGASLAGSISGTSARLSDLMLPPGPTPVSIQGIDLDGTAGARIRWRSAYTTL